MARPVKATVDYFPHDAHASDGDTITILEGQFGNDGYAFWFKLLERISTTENHVIDVRNPVKWKLLLAKTHLTEATGTAILDLLATLGAIDTELWQKQKTIWCQNLVNRISDAYRNRKCPVPTKPTLETNRQISDENNPVSDENNPVSDTTSLVSDTDNPQKKGKEKKGKRVRAPKKTYGEFNNVLLTDTEYSSLKERFNGQLDAKIAHFSSQKEAKGYEYKSDYAAILTWERSDAAKQNGRPNNPKSQPQQPSRPELEYVN